MGRLLVEKIPAKTKTLTGMVVWERTEINLTIAEFMGAVRMEDDVPFVLFEGTYKPDKKCFHRVSDLKYDRSSDWLLPVVDKIESTLFYIPPKYRRGFLQDKEEGYVFIDALYCSSPVFCGWSSRVSFVYGANISRKKTVRYRSKHEALYFGCAAFINWLLINQSDN